MTKPPDARPTHQPAEAGPPPVRRPARRWAGARLLVAALALPLAAVTLQAGLASTAGASAPAVRAAAVPTTTPTTMPTTRAPTTTPTGATPTGTTTSCPPALPSAGFVSATRTSLVISASALCRQVATLHLYGSADGSLEAGAWTMPTRLSSGRARFVNLAADTSYWYRITWVVGPDAPVQSGPLLGPIRTLAVDPVVDPPVPTPTPTCTGSLPTLTLQGRTPYSLAFDVANVCNGPATLRLFADGAGQSEVTRWTVPPTYTATGGEVLVVTRLRADTAYWFGLYPANPDGLPIQPLQGTLTGQISPIPPTPTTATPTATSTVTPTSTTCGSARLLGATRTTLAFSTLTTCPTVDLILFADAEGRTPVGVVTQTSGSPAGDIRFGNLQPETRYWYRLGVGAVQGPVSTPATDPPTPTFTRGCPGVVPMVEFVSAGDRELRFSYRFLCDRTVTVHLFADAAGTRELVSAPVDAGRASSGTLDLTRLFPGTAYYHAFSVNGLTSPVQGPVRTTGVPPTTCTPIAPYATLQAATRTTVRLGYVNPCGPAVTLELFRDQAATQLIGRAVRPAGTRSVPVTFAGLSPDTDYWYRVANVGSPAVRVRTTLVDPTPTAVPSPVPCPPVVPTVALDAAGDRWLSLAYGFACGPITLRLYADAAGTQVVAAAPGLGTGGSDGVVVFTQLPADTAFWYALGPAFGQPGGPVQGPVRTLASTTPTTSSTPTGGASCTAVLRVVSRWGDGFTAEVEVRNTGTVPVTWSAAWTWTGGESLVQGWNATVAGTPTSPVLTGVAWNAQVQPGRSATAGLLGRGSASTTAPAVTCRGV